MKFVFESIQNKRGTSRSILAFALAFDKKHWPKSGETNVLLAIPPGDQSTEMVHEAYDAWMPHLVKKGWVIACPVAPKGKLFFQGSERLIPGLLDELQKRFKPHMQKVHLLGISNGGISAFRLATLNSSIFHSITVIPGWPKPADITRIGNIRNIPVHFIVGADDEWWLEKARKTDRRLKKLGCRSSLTVIPNGDHFAFRKIKPNEIEKIVTASSSYT